jgi:hypothetical protein
MSGAMMKEIENEYSGAPEEIKVKKINNLNLCKIIDN